MYKEIGKLREKDWSLNLEDEYYDEHVDEAIEESVEAVKQTGPGRYVNIVTTGASGDPRDWLFEPLLEKLKLERVDIKELRYIDECGCGGHVSRVYR